MENPNIEKTEEGRDCRSNEIIASISHELLQWIEQKVSDTDIE